MRVVTAGRHFAFPDNISVLENMMRADYLVLSVYRFVCTLWFC